MTQVSQADLLWLAAIDDKTVKFFQDFDKRLDRMEQKHNQTFNSMQKKSDSASRAMGLIGGAIGAVTHQLISMGMQAIRSFEQMVKGSIQLAARADTLAIALKVVGGNAGYSVEELDKLEEAIKANGITTNAARQIMLQMAQANLDLSKAVDLTRVAQDAAVIAGLDSSATSERLLHSVVTLNPLIARQVGITINAEQAYKKYTGGVDGAVESLTYAQKQTMFLNEMLEQGAQIAGTYEAAMGTAGKQAASMARYQEELQLAMGRVFQPAYLEWIQFLTRTLKEAKEWFDENSDAVEEFGRRLSVVMKEALKLVELLASKLSDIKPLLIESGQLIASAFVDLDEQGMEERTSGIGKAGAQLITLLTAAFVTGIKVVTEAVTILYNLVAGVIDMTIKIIRDPLRSIEDVLAEAEQGVFFTRAAEHIQGFGDAIIETAANTVTAMGQMTGALDIGSEEIKKDADKIISAANEIAEETLGAIEKITELNAKFEKELTEMALKRAREQIEDEIKEARRREDIARSNIKRIEKVYKDAAKRRTDALEDLREDERELLEDQADERKELTKDHADDLLDVEKDYQKELRDIQRDYVLDVEEAARQNDAVAVARLIRQRNRQIQEAKIDRDDSITEAKSKYSDELDELKIAQEERRQELRQDAKERLEDLEDQLQEALTAAEEARQEDLDNLTRSLAQEKEDKERHRQWDMEDLQKKHEADLKAAGDYFAQLKYINESALESLLASHGQYIKDDEILWDAYYAKLRGMQTQGTYGAYGIYRPPGMEDYEESMDPSTGQYVPSPIAQRPITQQPVAQQPIQRTPIGGSPYDPPANIKEHCRLHPNDPVCKWYGLDEGGLYMTTSPTRFMSSVKGQPELIAAIPLNASVNHNHNINMTGRMSVDGVSPDMEAQMGPAMLAMLGNFGQALLAGRSYGRVTM